MGDKISGILDSLRAEGRGGDTELAHVNPQEKAALKRMGGSGSINPRTGLREFLGGSGMGGPMAGGGGDAGLGGGMGDRNDVGGMGYGRAGPVGSTAAPGGALGGPAASILGGGPSITRTGRNVSSGPMYSGLGGLLAQVGLNLANLQPTVGPTMADVGTGLQMAGPLGLIGSGLGWGVQKEQQNRENAAMVAAGLGAAMGDPNARTTGSEVGPETSLGGNLYGGATGNLDIGAINRAVAGGTFSGSTSDYGRMTGAGRSDSILRQVNGGAPQAAAPTPVTAPVTSGSQPLNQPQASGLASPSGRTVIGGGSSIMWPWSTLAA